MFCVGCLSFRLNCNNFQTGCLFVVSLSVLFLVFHLSCVLFCLFVALLLFVFAVCAVFLTLFPCSRPCCLLVSVVVSRFRLCLLLSQVSVTVYVSSAVLLVLRSVLYSLFAWLINVKEPNWNKCTKGWQTLRNSKPNFQLLEHSTLNTQHSTLDIQHSTSDTNDRIKQTQGTERRKTPQQQAETADPKQQQHSSHCGRWKNHSIMAQVKHNLTAAWTLNTHNSCTNWVCCS